MTLMIPYPDIGSVALQLGPFAIRWYALAYITGLVLGWRYCLALIKRPPHVMTRLDIDDFLVWATLGVVLGGRIGYVLFYRPGYYVTEPLEALELWHGGMSFHGGCAGVALAMWLFARRRNIPLLCLADIVACAEPLGQFFGRLANFVNGELWGRTTDVAWAMVFPHDPLQLPRHPSQLYQAGMEGLLLFILLFILQRSGLRQRPGALTGVFLVGYAVTRSIGELFREPDAQLGFLFLGTTMGQLLSIPMILGGLWLIRQARKPPESAAA
jgi:phosphatidylglycerol:prolipoprotein diacylglycerol transferase